MNLPPRVELFHRVADPPSARVRRFVVEQALEERVRFRNLAYPEVEADWQARGAKLVPALWDGARMFEGAEAVLSRLQALLDIGRGP